MKKFVLSILFLLHCQICSAELVQVSDMQIMRFITNCNEVISSHEKHLQIKLETSQRLGNYNLFVGGIGNATVTFFTNEDGSVSKIALISKTDSQNSIYLGNLLRYACLKTIGLNDDEIRSLIKSFEVVPSVWCMNAERRIMLDSSKSTTALNFVMVKASDS